MGSFVVPRGLCYVVRYRTEGVAVARKPTDTVQLKLSSRSVFAAN